MKKANSLFNVLILSMLLICGTLFTPNSLLNHHSHAFADAGISEIAPCYKYGLHQMRIKGQAVVKNYKTKKNIFVGKWYQCGCGQKFIAEGSPENGVPIYRYITQGGIKSEMGIGGQGGFYVDPNLVYYTSNTRIPGYKFIF